MHPVNIVVPSRLKQKENLMFSATKCLNAHMTIKHLNPELLHN